MPLAAAIRAPVPKAAPGSASLLAEIRQFNARVAPTSATSADGIPYFTNEFWTASQRQAHAIHEISYRACFKPQLPAFFIERLTEPGDAVLDPFMGRGTTPIQAALMGRRPVGSDINPLSVLLTRPRLAPPPCAALAARLQDVPWSDAPDVPEDLLAFYHPETLKSLCALRAWLLDAAPIDNPAPDPATDWIRMVALNRLTGHSPGFFSVYTLPPNQAASVTAQRRINARRNQVPPHRDVAALILRKSAQLLRHGGPPPHPPPLLATGRADTLGHVADASVALVVTSPPFLDVVQYREDNALRCWFAGIDPAAVAISMHRTEPAWRDAMRAVLAELARVLRPGGHVAFEVGEVRAGKVLLERSIWHAAEGLPFERLAVMVNAQSFTKTANCWGIDNNAKGTNSNRIVLLRRK
jgi:hypothetical protein